MRKLYNAINNMLIKVDFSAIWPGFQKCPFALYNETDVYFESEVIPCDNRFLGNTSIEYNGEYIAIWKVKNPSAEDSQLLASNMVHEMFHVFQKNQNEKRFPNDLVMLDYPVNLENYQLKYYENTVLANAYNEKDGGARQELLAQFVLIRKCREKIIGDIINQEYLTETIEGVAEYAGCMALKQLSPGKFHIRMLEYTKKISALDESFFDIRRSLYYSGAIFLLLLAKQEMDFYHKLGDTDTAVFPLIAGKIALSDAAACYHKEADLAELYAAHFNCLKGQFYEFLDTHRDKVDLEAYICGYDPMNMVRMDNMILCTHFIMLKNYTMAESMFIKGPVLLYLKVNSHNQIYAYSC